MKHKKDRRIREVIALYREDWEAALPTDEQIEETVCISDELEARMMDAINGQKKKRSAGRLLLRVAACAAAIALVGATVLVAGGKNGLWSFSQPNLNIHGEAPPQQVTIEKDESQYPIDFEGDLMLPDNVPNGFVLTEVMGMSTNVCHTYENATGQYLRIYQIFTDAARPLEVEEQYCKTVKITEKVEGIYYSKDNSELIFEYEEYTFVVGGSFFLEDFIEFARSMIK